MKVIEHISEDLLEVEQGSLFPALHRLEDRKWVSSYWGASENNRKKSLLGDPVKDRAIYEGSSPLQYIRNETAPLLVLQGENDIRVPREEAEQVVDILKAEGRTVAAVYYPEEGHGFVKREHQRDELTCAAAWLQKYLQGAE